MNGIQLVAHHAKVDPAPSRFSCRSGSNAAACLSVPAANRGLRATPSYNVLRRRDRGRDNADAPQISTPPRLEVRVSPAKFNCHPSFWPAFGATSKSSAESPNKLTTRTGTHSPRWAEQGGGMCEIQMWQLGMGHCYLPTRPPLISGVVDRGKH